MRRPARQLKVYWAALAAASIALLSALEAWVHLEAESSGSAGLLLADSLIGLLLPLAGLLALVAGTWLARRLMAARRGRDGDPLGTREPHRSGDEPAVPGSAGPADR